MTEGAGRERWLRHYRELVLGELPHRAGERRVVTEDHCFWSHRPRHGCRRLLVRRAGPAADPAFTQLDDEQVSRAVDLAERMLRGRSSAT